MHRALRRIQERNELLLEDSPKRGCIALIIRIPGYSQPSLDAYLDNMDPKAEPELLFIKRTVSKRDRWSGHIAVPGGRQDPGETDLQTAVREAKEEVGLDLEKDGYFVGTLDQRKLKVSWGRRLAMILCPFVFILNDPDAKLTPQWTEVATCFWYPISKLMDEKTWVHEHVPVGDRVNLSRLPRIVGTFLRWQIGDMMFSAIEMTPSEIVNPPADIEPAPLPPYKVWGVTLGVLIDFFEVLKPGMFPKSTMLPTMQPWDMRFIIYVLGWSNRKSKTRELVRSLQQTGPLEGRLDLANKMLDGHFAYLQQGIVLALLLRLTALVYIVKRWRGKL